MTFRIETDLLTGKVVHIEQVAYSNRDGTETVLLDVGTTPPSGLYPAKFPEPTAPEVDPKLVGVEFEGVLCSATKEDMWGLSAVAPWVQAGNSTAFEFDNGNVLVLTPDNYRAFTAVWGAYRASFFPVP